MIQNESFVNCTNSLRLLNDLYCPRGFFHPCWYQPDDTIHATTADWPECLKKSNWPNIFWAIDGTQLVCMDRTAYHLEVMKLQGAVWLSHMRNAFNKPFHCKLVLIQLSS